MPQPPPALLPGRDLDEIGPLARVLAGGAVIRAARRGVPGIAARRDTEQTRHVRLLELAEQRGDLPPTVTRSLMKRSR